MQLSKRRYALRAFTLIELLVVIAIIAILAAILFPVFATVREQARQSSTMSKLHTMYVGARLFYEDEGRFPSALFGYAETPLVQNAPTDPASEPALSGDGITAMDKAVERFTYNTHHNDYLWGEQVKNFSDFLCDDNLTNNQANGKQDVTEVYYPLTLTNGTPKLVTWTDNDFTQTCKIYADADLPIRQQTGNSTPYIGQPKLYYTMDSMDIGPMLDPATGQQREINGEKAYELHYSPDWTHERYNLTNGCDMMGGNAITTQLKYKNPPTENTILTWNTDHAATAGSSSVLILLLSGTARKINYSDALKELPFQYK